LRNFFYCRVEVGGGRGRWEKAGVRGAYRFVQGRPLSARGEREGFDEGRKTRGGRSTSISGGKPRTVILRIKGKKEHEIPSEGKKGRGKKRVPKSAQMRGEKTTSSEKKESQTRTLKGGRGGSDG